MILLISISRRVKEPVAQKQKCFTTNLNLKIEFTNIKLYVMHCSHCTLLIIIYGISNSNWSKKYSPNCVRKGKNFQAPLPSQSMEKNEKYSREAIIKMRAYADRALDVSRAWKCRSQCLASRGTRARIIKGKSRQWTRREWTRSVSRPFPAADAPSGFFFSIKSTFSSREGVYGGVTVL